MKVHKKTLGDYDRLHEKVRRLSGTVVHMWSKSALCDVELPALLPHDALVQLLQGLLHVVIRDRFSALHPEHVRNGLAPANC